MAAIAIGREAVGKDCILVPSECKMVGRHHAELILDYENGAVYIKEVDAKNGTFVNGRRVAKSGVLKCGDQVWLGEIDGPLGYKVDVDEYIRDIKNDYSEEFEHVKSIYEAYKKEMDMINEEYKRRTIWPQNIISAIFAVLAAAFLLSALFQHNTSTDTFMTRMSISILGVAITALSRFIPFGKNYNVEKFRTDALIKYKDQYCCPKCKTKFNLNTSWRIIQEEHCPNKKCNAKYKK